MSKKIWRGKERHCPDGGRDVQNYWGGVYNATVVPDDACFPVREAMVYIKSVEDFNADASIKNGERMDKTWADLMKTIERMKKKAKVQRGS